MFEEYLVILKRTDWDGRSETFVEQYKDFHEARKAERHLYKENVAMKEEFQKVAVAFVITTEEMIEITQHDHAQVARASKRV